jgi:phage gp36-like protein
MLASVVLPVPYCDLYDCEDRLSVAGVNLRADDNPATVLGGALMRASTKIDGFLFFRYEVPVLPLSYWVSEKAATLACYYLCGRRGNSRPNSIVADYKEAIADLEATRTGGMDIPGATPRRTDGPVMSNMTTRLAPVMHTRVHSSISPNSGGAPTDYQQIMDFSRAVETWLQYPSGW